MIALVALGSAAHAGVFHVYESRKGSATTEGEALIATDPETAFRTAVDYERWTRIFPTVQRAIIAKRDGNEARVTFVHTDGTREDLHFRNRPTTRTVWFEQIGGQAEVWAEITFAPGDLPNTTRVHSRLYADVHGIASAFVSDRELRELRQKQVREDLLHLQAFFGRS